MKHRLLMLACAMALSACGAAVPHGPAQPSPSLVADRAASPEGRTPGVLLPSLPPTVPNLPQVDLSRPVVLPTVCGDWPSDGPPTLRQLLSAVSPASNWYKTAAVVTVVSAGVPFYNTPDRARWTQAWLSAQHDPDIYTPYTFRVQRPLAAGLTAGQTITGYVEGGSMPNGDNIRSCIGQPIGNPAVGAQAVVIFSARNMKELPTGPVVTQFDVIQGDHVMTDRGREPIP